MCTLMIIAIFPKSIFQQFGGQTESLEKMAQGQEVEAVFEQTVERIYSSAITRLVFGMGTEFWLAKNVYG
jgi:hypothetical protein